MAAAESDVPADAPLLPSIPSTWPCTLGRTKLQGRYAVTTERVAAGAAVLEDRPYAAVVADAHRGYCCAYCINLCTTRAFQCGGCRLAHYCSEVSVCI